MPIIKSAKKRVRVAKRATRRNARTKRTTRLSIKQFQAKPSANAIQEAQSNIDTSVKKGILSKNKAARMKSRLSSEAKAAGVKPTKKTKTTAPTKKAVAKKPVAKKSPAKKATKAPAKKK